MKGMFVPATFDLYEFDDGPAGTAERAGRRWFSGWNGLISRPPQNVTLGWSDDRAAVLVCTAGSRPLDTDDARGCAAYLALGGTELPIPGRPESPAGTVAEMDRIRSAGELWSRRPGILPGGPPAQTIICAGFTVGYLQLPEGAIYLAAVGLAPDQLSVRKVPDWVLYDVDASTSLPLSELPRR